MIKVTGLSRRRAVIFSIVILIAAAHVLRLGSYLQGQLFNYYYSYFSDIVLPFTYYFILCVSEEKIPDTGFF